MEKGKLEPISKTRILKNELPDFEWIFLDIKQVQSRIIWLKEWALCVPCDKKPSGRCIRDNHSIVVPINAIEEAFKEIQEVSLLSSHD